MTHFASSTVAPAERGRIAVDGFGLPGDNRPHPAMPLSDHFCDHLLSLSCRDGEADHQPVAPQDSPVFVKVVPIKPAQFGAQLVATLRSAVDLQKQISGVCGSSRADPECQVGIGGVLGSGHPPL